MSINEFPDKCLLAIFDHLNYLDDLISCYKVSVKWRDLVIKRTKKVKYLIDDDPVDCLDCVYFRGDSTIDGAVLRSLFGHLKVIDFTFCGSEKLTYQDIVELVKNQESIKGIIYRLGVLDDPFKQPIAKYYNQLEMIYTAFIDDVIPQNSSNVKQLNLWDYSMDYFTQFQANRFTNLERLNIRNPRAYTDSPYNGPEMEKLKIVELYLSGYLFNVETFHGFQFIDSCPNLQSAHFTVACKHFAINEWERHESLQDLVIKFVHDTIEWYELKKLLTKYPNLKHLALRGNENIKDENIKQLLEMLPNLVLLDVRECDEITEDATNYVQDFCKRNGRSIKFYENDDQFAADWPDLSTKRVKICRGFDFMKHCFFKDFDDLPVFLVNY